MTNKWRPNKSQNLYVIPDIHGNIFNLETILKTILPLRKRSDDKIIFLGDYIDRHQDSHALLDLLISLKEEYKEKVVFLRGNHEDMLLIAMGEGDPFWDNRKDDFFHMWKENGGFNTILGYLNRIDSREMPLDIYRGRLNRLIPAEHIHFMKETIPYHKEGKFVFVHGGCNPFLDIEEQSEFSIYWDRKLVNSIQAAQKNKTDIIWDDWKFDIICGHSGPIPVIDKRYMMLDAESPMQLLVVEAHSRQAFMAKDGQNRLVSYEISNCS